MRFSAGRLIQSMIVLLAMSFVVYALIGLMPGDPIDLMISADPRMTTEDASRLREVYGLDRPLVERWTGLAGGGAAGRSRLVALAASRCWRRWRRRWRDTALLMGLALSLTLAIALPAGIIAARRPHSATDRAHRPRRLRRHLDAAVLAGAAADHRLRGDPGLAAGGCERGPAAASSTSCATWCCRSWRSPWRVSAATCASSGRRCSRRCDRNRSAPPAPRA